MNKTMLTGMLAGVGIAVAGGVAGFTLFGGASGQPGQEIAAVETAPEQGAVAAVAAPMPAPAPAQVRAPAPAPAQPAAAPPPVARTVAAEPAVAEECWDEEVVVQAEARDDKAIAGTAAGALIGGALGDRLGRDDDLVTAAGAAAGAFLGRKAQREFQENRTTTTIERRCAPVGSR